MTSRNQQNGDSSSKNWGNRPKAMDVWGQVGVSMKVANYAAKLANHDPNMSRRIRRNLLIEEIIPRLQEKRNAATRRAQDATKRATALTKAAELKRQEAHKKMKCDNVDKADLLALKAYYLEKEAEKLWNEADTYIALATLAQDEEDEARHELARLVIPHRTSHPFDEETVNNWEDEEE